MGDTGGYRIFLFQMVEKKDRLYAGLLGFFAVACSYNLYYVKYHKEITGNADMAETAVFWPCTATTASWHSKRPQQTLGPLQQPQEPRRPAPHRTGSNDRLRLCRHRLFVIALAVFLKVSEETMRHNVHSAIGTSGWFTESTSFRPARSVR
jgi:hypothetical protein